MNKEKALYNRADFLRSLLKEFDLVLLGFDPGVLAMGKETKHRGMNFDGLEWTWLEPLLVELRERRKNAKG